VESFDFGDFNVGDYYGAVREKMISETLSKVLYPNDEAAAVNGCVSRNSTSSSRAHSRTCSACSK
jgi:glucan phosphorylase